LSPAERVIDDIHASTIFEGWDAGRWYGRIRRDPVIVRCVREGRRVPE
jgi:hypothetical protein